MNKKKLETRISKLGRREMLLTFSLMMFLMLSCNTYKKNNIVQKALPTVQLIINTDSKIDNVVFTKIGGFSKEDLMPFQETIAVILNEPTNDLYQLLCEQEGQFLVEQLWLNGEDIIINASVKGDALQIDTVINAPFYYYSKRIMSEYTAMTKKEISNEKSNNFLLREIKQNINHPFSNILADKYINDNIGKLNKLRKLQVLIKNQNQQIKAHILSVHENLNALINIDSIKFSEFKFNNLNGEESDILIHEDTLYLLDFWFTGCAPCISDHKTIKTQLAKFEEANVNIIGISTDFNQPDWKVFLEKHQYEWDNYIEVKEEGKALSEYVGISSYPTYIVVNGKGKILNRNNSIEESIAFLNTAKVKQ